MATKPKRLSGGAYLIRSGYRPISLGVTPEQHDMLRMAAEADNRPMTQFVIHHSVMAAKKLLEKIGKNAK